MKQLSFIVIFSLVLSLVFLPSSNAVTKIRWIDVPFEVSHIVFEGETVYIGGTTMAHDDVDNSMRRVIDMGLGTISGENINISTYWVPPRKTSLIIYQQYEDAPVTAIVYTGRTMIISTIHGYYIWPLSVSKPKLYGNGAGLDDMSVIDGKVYATRFGTIGTIDLSNGKFTDLTGNIQHSISQANDVGIALYVVFPYKDYIVGLGVGGVLFFKQDGAGLKLVKSYIDKDVDSRYDLDPDSAMQGGFTVWKHYVMLPDKQYDLIRVVDLDSGKSFTVEVPANIYRVATDGTYLYGATPKGRIFAFNIDVKHERVGILWQIDLKKPVYSIAVKDGYVYVATGEKKIGVISNSLQFSDISEDYWAYDAIRYLSELGIINGYPDGTFRPEKSVTRAEFAKMLALAMNLDPRCDDTLPEIYVDVHAGDWFCPYVTAVVKAGYMRGYGGGRFGPNNKVKKEEILTTIVRVKGWTLINPSTPTFPDVSKSHWSYRYIETALQHGIVKKNDPHITDGKFHLGVPATRAQTAVFIYRMIR